MTYLQGDCSYKRAEEEGEIQRWSSACSQYPPCHVDAELAHLLPGRGEAQLVGRRPHGDSQRLGLATANTLLGQVTISQMTETFYRYRDTAVFGK